MKYGINNHTNDLMNAEYNALSNHRGKVDMEIFSMNPVTKKPNPTDEDYQVGKMTRFFVKKNTSPNFPIYEVDREQYDKFTNNAFYTTTFITWSITGKPYTFADQQNYSVAGAYELNKIELMSAENEIPGISNIVQNLLEFFIET